MDDQYPEIPENKCLDWRVRQMADLSLRYEIRVKGNTTEECKALLMEAKKELDKICH
jgi:hypothetical protein